MRALPIVLAFFPTFVLADEIALTSDVTAVTLYPQGATVTREIPFDMPAGRHELVLTDLPAGTPLDTVRVAADGVTLGSLALRNDFVPPRAPSENAAIEAAEAEVERLEQALRDGQAEVERITLEQRAAEARVTFLRQLGEGDGVAAMEIGALRELLGLIGEETLAAQQGALDARLRAEEADRALKDLREELDDARQALLALVPEDKARAMLAVTVSAEAEARGTLTVSYNIWDAAWQPVYDVRLDRGSGALALERGALVMQNTGENWRDVALTLSTVRPSEQVAPGRIWPWQRWIEDPEAARPKELSRVQANSGFAGDQEVLAEAMVAEETAAAAFDGLAVTYSYPQAVSVASNADNLRLSLGTLTTQAEVVAQAVPLTDRTAFLVASLTNDMQELILPGAAMFYLDGRFIGQQYLDLIAAGAEARLSFGPIDGVRLTRTVLDRNEGDRGIITKSNELQESVEIELENLTGEAWPVRLLDRVPFSEQEDLEISWSANPKPSEENVEGERGILAWEFELGAGETRLIELNHTLEWPEGKILR